MVSWHSTHQVSLHNLSVLAGRELSKEIFFLILILSKDLFLMGGMGGVEFLGGLHPELQMSNLSG